MHRLFSFFLNPTLIILCCSGLVFGGEFETVLEKAEQGNSTAQNYLGLMYAKGQGVTQDYQQAFYWFAKAADLGHGSAHNSLGIMYYKGHGVERNFKESYILNFTRHITGFSMMYFQDPSLLIFQRRLQKTWNLNNLKTMFNIESIPKDTQLLQVACNNRLNALPLVLVRKRIS